jgi:NitT/TauT family transport system ATP-binding protein
MSFLEVADVDLVYAGGPGTSRGETLALSDTSLTVARNGFVALVGPSGCGKSTLLKLVSGLVKGTRGSVRVAGEEVVGSLKNVGMAFQNPTLLPWRNIRDNALLPLDIVEPYRNEPNNEKKRARPDELLTTVGLSELVDRMPWELSGGMQQRAQLCRALVHSPSILLLDEPFAALDAFTREELWGVLQNLWMHRKCTVILVTHELREAVYLSGPVHIMSAGPGRVIASRSIPLPRPRTLDMTFESRFVDLVHECRQHISLGKAS